MHTTSSWKRIQLTVVSGLTLLSLCFTESTRDARSDELPAPKKHLFLAADHTRLTADIYTPTTTVKHPAVILLHQLGKSNVDMLPLVSPLLQQGFIVANLDMRGHGNSTGQDARRISFKQFSLSDWALLPSDLETILKNLKTIPSCDGNKLAIVGASIGANAAVIAAKDDTSVKALTLLSPGLEFHALKPAIAMASLNRPVLLVAARDDSYSAESAEKLSKLDKKSSLDLIPTGGHGGQMLTAHPELATQIATWLRKAVQ